LINAGTTVSISGMKITGGNATSPTSGGGIRSSGSLTLTNVDVDTNSANSTGGGILSLSNLTISNSFVRNNTAVNSFGGGIYHGVGTLTITNSTISNNNCPSVNGHGGGVEVDTGTGTITNSTIMSNQAGNVGGGINIEQGVLTVNNSNISNNSAVQSGGGISHGRTCISPAPCSLTINNSTLSNNLLTGPGGTGGGVFADGDSSVMINSSTISGSNRGGIVVGGLTSTISNSTISGNTGRFGGGLELISLVSDLLTNSTVTNNTTTEVTGASGVRGSGSVTVRSTIIAGNINNMTNSDVTGSFISSGYNLIGNVGTATGFGAIGDQTGTGASPINPRLDALGNYGGPTQTHRLQISPVVSPAIDAGNSFGLTTDQRGQMRTVDHPSAPFALVGDNTDIGAFEALAPLSATVSISGRVTTAQGNGIRNAFVRGIDSNANARAVKTGTFGYYSLNNIAVGQTYTIAVASKRFEFATQVISLSGEMTNVDFIAQ
nr:choice-of-anchor Q domain-containing protein [Pyrinomonadaceae bacterium]